jgi:archaemetzincin
MNVVRLLPIGAVDLSILENLRAAIPSSLNVQCEIMPMMLDPAASYHAERQQYHSSEILRRMQDFVQPQPWRILGVADVDLYIPILKYVFGEAQMGGPCAVVSFHRLRQEFYGLDRNDALLNDRLLKESIHELGHTLDLRHCDDYRCVMASAHAVEWIDVREANFCESCRSQVRLQTSLLDRFRLPRKPKSPLP